MGYRRKRICKGGSCGGKFKSMGKAERMAWVRSFKRK
jgi:hypothetical protein